MASLREIKNRIKSVKSTEKITKAMKMVAASKLRKAQVQVLAPRSFVSKLDRLISLVALKMKALNEESHPLLIDRPKKENIEILALSSDRGLCGALNSNVLRTTLRFIFDEQEKYKNIYLSCIGKKGFEFFVRQGIDIRKNYQSSTKAYDFELAKIIASELCERFVSKKVDAVFLIYNRFKSAINQEVVIEQLLPIKHPPSDTLFSSIDFIYEPDRQSLLEVLVPRHFASRLYQAFLESYASEQGARMTAMDNATRNAKEMTQNLTLQYNRGRQAAITKELMEIISGAEAL